MSPLFCGTPRERERKNTPFKKGCHGIMEAKVVTVTVIPYIMPVFPLPFTGIYF
jgi:hypothetical protein